MLYLASGVLSVRTCYGKDQKLEATMATPNSLVKTRDYTASKLLQLLHTSVIT